ncbi:hypothetical protein KM043_005911 [Ampulex compressa]|nr:hypothetical protein KM043_005911 [Ampulex compressa]
MPLCAKRTEIIDNQTVRSQAFPIYRGLLDPRTSPSFEIVQLMQCLAGFVVYSVTISACSLAAVFVMHACGQFKIFVSKLGDLIDETRRRNEFATFDRRMGDIVEHHIRTLGFIYRVEELLNEICFVECVGCTMNICFLGYYLLKSRNVGLAAYMIDWYRLPGKTALGLILIIAISDSSIKLSAGKFVELSLASFCSVVKSSLAYLSLLRTLTT